MCKKCGFGSENHPKKLFRERYNMTMRDYRAAEQAQKLRKGSNNRNKGSARAKSSQGAS